MNMEQDFIIGVVSGIGTAVILALLALAWRWLTTVAPSRSFWRIEPADGVHIAVSLPNLDPSEYAVYIPTGDSLAFGEIAAFLRRLYPNLEITFHRNAKLPVQDWN